MAFSPSPQQRAGFEWIFKGSGNARVDAVAGAGKTTFLLHGMRLMNGYVFTGQFNKRNAVEVEGKMSGMGFDKRFFEAGTMHSAGFSAWRRYLGPEKAKVLKVDDKKLRQIYDLMYPRMDDEREADPYASFVCKTVSMAKQRAFGIINSSRDADAWREMIEHFGLDENLGDSADEYEAIQRCISVFTESAKLCKELIDYDDMIWAPLYFQARFFQRDWVLVDECQDTNPSRRLLAKALLKPKGRLIAVGDPRQCHPGDTLVTTPQGKVRIDDLRVGDKVVRFSPQDNAFVGRNTQAGKVTGKQVRQYTGPLLTFNTEHGQRVRVTPNHRMYVRFNVTCDTHVVYLAVSGGKMRIGSTKWNHDGNCGLPLRARQEKAEEAWILHMCESQDEARMKEYELQRKYGISGTAFHRSEYSWNPEIFPDFLLERDKPLWRKGVRLHLGYALVTEASNVYPGYCLMLVDDGGKGHWQEITREIEDFSGPVYSLEVEPTHQGAMRNPPRLYVADDIVVHNCLYGFTGADNDAMDQIEKDFNCTRINLTVSFRCPKAVVAVARRWVDHIEAHPSAPEGKVREIEFKEFEKEQFQPTDFIICRYNKPIIQLAYKLISRKIPCRVEGRDIGKGLLALIGRWKVNKLDPLRERLEEYRDREVQKALEKGQEQKADTIADKVETVMVLCDALLSDGKHSVQDLRDLINSMFSDSGEKGQRQVLTLMTGHKSKGLETERVYWLGFDTYHPSKYARKDWQVQQEDNICYVIATRAKHELVMVKGAVPEEKK